MFRMKTPCEIFVWYVLPGIRRELALSMIENHDLSQVKVAKMLGITEAAVSQYVSRKRGNIDLEPEIKAELCISAERIILGDGRTVVRELCRICAITKESQTVQELYRKHTGVTIHSCGL